MRPGSRKRAHGSRKYNSCVNKIRPAEAGTWAELGQNAINSDHNIIGPLSTPAEFFPAHMTEGGGGKTFVDDCLFISGNSKCRGTLYSVCSASCLCVACLKAWEKPLWGDICSVCSATCLEVAQKGMISPNTNTTKIFLVFTGVCLL